MWGLREPGEWLTSWVKVAESYCDVEEAASGSSSYGPHPLGHTPYLGLDLRLHPSPLCTCRPTQVEQAYRPSSI